MAMVVQANRVNTELGGHIASFASSATLYDVGFNHFFRAPTDKHGGDLLFVQGHSAPGIYARAFLAGRVTESVRVAVLNGPNVLIVHHVFRPDDSVQILEVGASIPWNASALGKAIVNAPLFKCAVAGNDPWGAATLEWSIPSPPPEYNFAQIPEVESRYPLWDLKSPERTAGIEHSHADAVVITDAHAVPMHEEKERHTAKELGIPMPFPTAKPLVVAFSMVVMFSGLLFLRNDMFAVSMKIGRAHV